MVGPFLKVGERAVLRREDFDGVFHALAKKGFRVLGPKVRDGAIALEEVSSSSDLPVGWTSHTEAGAYRLSRTDSEALFGFGPSQDSFKRRLHTPYQTHWTSEKRGQNLHLEWPTSEAAKYAVLGLRACDLAAIAIMDRVLLGGPFVDRGYRSRREALFVVAVNCTRAGETCFCASMGTGPRVKHGHDVLLTEILDGGEHRFLAEAGTRRGAELLAELDLQRATPEDAAFVEARLAEAEASMGRTLETEGIRDLLYDNAENPLWEDVAKRCLACGNCTMVCPTCFCSTVEHPTSLDGSSARREKRWDSCFTADFSYIHGGSVRSSTMSRYRQWMTHKLASWYDQFGTSGCVGCGRCITWCPVGIDITAEARGIRENDLREVRKT